MGNLEDEALCFFGSIMSEVASPIYSGQFPVIQAIAQHIERAGQSQLSGSLNFDTVHIPRLRLFFVMGRLIWASGGQHRFRRWRRLLMQFCPGAIASSQYFSTVPYGPCWEYQILSKLIDENHLSREMARNLICHNITEVLFDTVQASRLIERFSCTQDEPLTPQETITLLPLDDLLKPLEQQWQSWCDARLGQYSPNLSPVLEQPERLRSRVSANHYDKLEKLLKGQYSLRELAGVMRQDLTQLSLTLVSYEQQGWIKLLATDDLALPAHIASPQLNPTKKTLRGPIRTAAMKAEEASKPLVLCVDDNEKICQQLGEVIESAGYRYLGLQDSVKALQMAIEQKPSLIFVDLVMPVIGGYELCSQLRRISAFKETPLVILTANDSMLDRMRGKMAGANAYLAKPATTEQILGLLDRWLPLKK